VNAKEKKFLEQLKEQDDFQPPKSGKGFFSKMKDTLGV
jgi:hypothetical protein